MRLGFENPVTAGDVGYAFLGRSRYLRPLPADYDVAMDPVRGAASYTVEVQFEGTIWVLVPHITASGYTLEFVGAHPGRWRVWAVGTNGEESTKSHRRDFRFSR